MSYPRLARILYNNPLLIEPSKAEVIEAVFRSYVEGDGISSAEAGERDFAAGIGRSKLFDDGEVTSARAGKGYFMTDGGIAVVPVLGTLVQRGGSMDSFSGIQSYQAIANALQGALADHRARGILLEIDSPGGEAAGLFDLAAQLRDIGAEKPLWAAANEFAYSAAYAIGSQAARLSLPESGSVGSIGVMIMHVDKSEAEKKRGLKFTPIFAGSRKNDFSSHAPLSPEAHAAAQATVDNLYELFVNAVAAGRKVNAQVARDTQAALLPPERAKAMELADHIEPFRQTLAQFRDELNSPQRHTYLPPLTSAKGQDMTTPATNQQATPPVAAGPTAEELASAKAATAAAQAQAATAAADATKAATARVAAILGHAEAAERQTFAKHLAFSTDMSVEKAAEMLAATPKETAAASNPLAGAMAGVNNPKVGADASSATGQQSQLPVASTASIYEMRRQAANKSRGTR